MNHSSSYTFNASVSVPAGDFGLSDQESFSVSALPGETSSSGPVSAYEEAVLSAVSAAHEFFLFFPSVESDGRGPGLRVGEFQELSDGARSEDEPVRRGWREFSVAPFGVFGWGWAPEYNRFKKSGNEKKESPYYLEFRLFNPKTLCRRQDIEKHELLCRFRNPLFWRDDDRTFGLLTDLGFKYIQTGEGELYVRNLDLDENDYLDPGKIASAAYQVVKDILNCLTKHDSPLCF